MTRAGTLAFAALAFMLPALAGAQTPVAPPRVGGYVQVRETAQEKVGLSATLNRVRVSADGNLPAKFAYRVLVEYQAPAGARVPATVSLREAIIRWAPNTLALWAGQFKTPFSKEYLLPVPVLETADFAAVVDSLAPKYDIGAMAEWTPGPWGVFSLGVFNGEGQNATGTNRDSLVLPVARAVLRPIAPLSIGASVARDSKDSLRAGVEATVEQWGGMARAEYITRHRTGRERDQDDFGWYVLGTLRVLPPVQLLGRAEDFQRPAYGVSRRVRAVTVGTNIEFAPNRVRLLVEGVRRATGPKQQNVNTLIGQLQVRL